MTTEHVATVRAIELERPPAMLADARRRSHRLRSGTLPLLIEARPNSPSGFPAQRPWR